MDFRDAGRCDIALKKRLSVLDRKPSIVQPPLTPADKSVLSSIAFEGKRRPEQYVATGFHDGNEVEVTEDAAPPD